MQFFFKRIEKVNITAENPQGEEKIYIDSFNTDMVITTTELEDGKRVVTLNDGHMESRYDNYPVIKGGKVTGMELRKEAAYYITQIVLEKDDSESYISMISNEKR